MLFWEPSKCHGGQIFAWQHCRISTNDEFDLASAKSGSTPANEQQKMWETYYGAFNKMEPHGNLQLHPNHPAVYSVSDSRVNRLVIYFVPVLSYLLKSRGCSNPNRVYGFKILKKILGFIGFFKIFLTIFFRIFF